MFERSNPAWMVATICLVSVAFAGVLQDPKWDWRDQSNNLMLHAKRVSSELVSPDQIDLTLRGLDGDPVVGVSKLEGIRFSASTAKCTVTGVAGKDGKASLTRAELTGGVQFTRQQTAPDFKLQKMGGDRLTYTAKGETATAVVTGNVSLIETNEKGEVTLKATGSKADTQLNRKTTKGAESLLLRTAVVTGPVAVTAKQGSANGAASSNTYIVSCGKMVLDRTRKPARLTLTQNVKITIRYGDGGKNGLETLAKVAVFRLNDKGEVVGVDMESGE